MSDELIEAMRASCRASFEAWWEDVQRLLPEGTQGIESMKNIAWGAFMGGWALGQMESVQ